MPSIQMSWQVLFELEMVQYGGRVLAVQAKTQQVEQQEPTRGEHPLHDEKRAEDDMERTLMRFNSKNR